MKKIIQIMQVVPIILITSYVGFYFCINLQEYANSYGNLTPLDNILVGTSLLSFSIGGYKLWNKTSLRSFSAVIILNLITEFEIYNYYQVYSIVIQVFLVTIILATTPKFRWE